MFRIEKTELASWIYDMWMGPFYLSQAGQVLTPLGTAAPLEKAAGV